MRAIELKTLRDRVRLNGKMEELPPFSYRNNILGIIARNPADLIGIARIRELDRLYAPFEAAKDGDVVNLEDADYKVLMGLLDELQMEGYNRYLVRLVDDLEAAPKLKKGDNDGA